jgi:hypothetical protein
MDSGRAGAVGESHGVAVETIYAKVAAKGDPLKLGPDYVKASTPVVAEQINRAAVRLAALLNRLQ